MNFWLLHCFEVLGVTGYTVLKYLESRQLAAARGKAVSVCARYVGLLLPLPSFSSAANRVARQGALGNGLCPPVSPRPLSSCGSGLLTASISASGPPPSAIDCFTTSQPEP